VTYRMSLATQTSRVAAIVGIALAIGFATLPMWGEGGLMRLLIQFFVLLAMAQMWNLLAGYGGMVSIGQQAFVGIGAYGLFIFTDAFAWNPLLAIGATAVLAMFVALLTSLFAFRLRDGYFAVGTWVIAEVFRIVVSQVPELGLGTGVSIQTWPDMVPADRLAITYWIALAVGIGAIVALVIILRSRLGLALTAIRDSELAASGLGVNVLRTKRVIYVIASVGCAIAGAVFYLHLLRVQPLSAFSVSWTAQMIFIVVIGGIGRIEGPIIGAVIFMALQETLSDYGSAYLVALGLFMIVIVLLAPRGIWGLVTSRWPIALFATQRRLARAKEAA